MKTLEHNAIHRSLAKMGFQLTEQILHAHHAADGFKLAEVVQQYQLVISGTAGSGAYADYTINFEEAIHYAPAQRVNKNEDPQVSHGVQLDVGDAIVHVNVKTWLFDENTNYVGAIVRVGVIEAPWDPGAAYSGTIHVSFQGFSAPLESADPSLTETP